MSNLSQSLNYEHFFSEDDLGRNFFYQNKLPQKNVVCSLKFKSDMVVAGLPFFTQTFDYLNHGPLDFNNLLALEGTIVAAQDNRSFEFELPFNLALTGERIALNLLQRASSIATLTKKFVDIADGSGIKILDTRKTTPGLRPLEKYAVRVGGGYNHRFGQADAFMIKDNHKKIFGGLDEALSFFKHVGCIYTPCLVEIHDLDELKRGIELNLKHVMLDNFSPDDIRTAIKQKPSGMTYEVSGGITLETLSKFLIEGVDVISVGSLTYDAPAIDVSLKLHPKG